MANYTIDPVTGIQIPTPSVDPGPDYAVNVSNALGTLAHLTHTGPANADGYQIPSAGINFNADISAQNNNLTTLRSVRFTPQSSPLAGSGDRAAVYTSGVDLWYNDANGNPIQITGGGQVHVTTSNNYPTKTVSSNYTINPSDGYIVFLVESTVSALGITLPLLSNVSIGRFYIFSDIQNDAGTNNITITCSGSDVIGGSGTPYGTTYQITSNGASIMLIATEVAESGDLVWQLNRFGQSVYNANEVVTFVNTGGNPLLSTSPTLKIDSGARLQVNSAINFTGGYLTGTAGGANDLFVTAGSINMNGGSINCLYPNAIVASAPSGIQVTGSAGITVAQTNGIEVDASQGISTNTGTIYLKNGPTDLTLNSYFRNQFTNFQPTYLPTNWTVSGGGYGALTTTSVTSTPFYFPLKLHNGALFASLTVIFEVNGVHSGVPQFLPSISLRATRYWTTPQYSGNSSSSGATLFSSPQDGSFNIAEPISPTGITTAAQWNSYSNLGVWTYYPSSSGFANFPIDTSLYNYYGSITDEHGTNAIAGNIYFGYYVEYTAINSMTFP